MKRTATILVFAAALVALGGSAKAALIEMDWKIPGDKQITRDTVNNLDWLDFDASTGYSVNQVKAGAGGFNAEGWRHATKAEADACMLPPE